MIQPGACLSCGKEGTVALLCQPCLLREQIDSASARTRMHLANGDPDDAYDWARLTAHLCLKIKTVKAQLHPLFEAILKVHGIA